MSKAFNIADGFIHLIFKNEKVEQMAKDRALICEGCDYLDIVDLPLINEPIHACGVCGCSIAAKTRAKEEKCPKSKW